MGLKKGDHIGGIRTTEDMRQRCYVCTSTGCWHLRTPHGKPLPKTATQDVWVHGVGLVSIRRAAWLLDRGSFPSKNRLVFAKCGEYDCVNPTHLAAWTRKEHGAWLRKSGSVVATPKQRARLIEHAESSRKLTDELARWAVESQQSAGAAAWALGVSRSLVSKFRRREKRPHLAAPCSVFALGDAVNAAEIRRAA